MMTANRLALMVLIGLMTLTFSPLATAQEGGDRGGDRGGERGGGDGERGGDRGNWRERWENMSDEEREAMRKRFEERMAEREKEQAEALRERLEMSAEDFEAIQPLINTLRNAMRERDSASRFGRGGPQRGGFPGGATGEPSKEAQAATEAMTELRQALEDDKTGDIKNALAKLRKARAALDAKVKAAQEELRGVCTAKWEAEFVVMGLLD